MYIKPCPHCNGKAYLTQSYSARSSTWFVFVKCNICGAQSKAYKSKEEPAEDWQSDNCQDAVTAWNMRNGVKDEDQDGL